MIRLILTLLLCLGMARAAVAQDYRVGYAAHLRGEFETAIDSYTRAIESADLSAEEKAHVHYNRGNARSALGEQRLALEDFDRALELAPGLTRAVYNRGVVRFYLAEFADAASDLDRALEREPENAYRMIWRYLARARSGEDAREALARNASAVNMQEWPGPLIAFLLGEGTLQQTVKATQDVDFEKQVTKTCEAAYYVGQQFLVQARPEQARRWFGTAVVTCTPPLVEFAGARAALARLDKPAANEPTSDDAADGATPPIAQSAEAPERLYEVTTDVNYRDGPGLSNARLGVLPAGTQLVVEDTVQGWARVRLRDGAVAFVHGRYLHVVQSSVVEPRRFVTTARVNYRTGPGTEHERVGTIDEGVQVRVDGAFGDWRRLRLDDGSHAFVHENYIHLVE